MILREAKPELGELCRWTIQGVAKGSDQSGSQRAFICICKMLFGYRARAGWTGSLFYEVDWCMGAVEPNGQLAEMVIERLAAMIVKSSGFEGIPRHSTIKPLFLDLEFMAQIGLGRNASREP